MRPIRFSKVVGAGNDFVLVDARKNTTRDGADLAKALCDRKNGIGADGLLLIGPSRRSHARMRIFNPDGSEAEMCGNGLRCVAWYLYEKKHTAVRERSSFDKLPSTRPSASLRTNGLTVAIETDAGILRAQIVGPERVRLFWAAPKQLRLGLKLTIDGNRQELHAVNTGVPHAVLLTRQIDRIDLNRLGSKIRHHRLFKPAGTNVDWIQIQSPHRIRIRTFERGVEGETLACGTGAVASAVIGAALGKLKPPVKVMTASGERLTVGFRQTRRPWEGLYLEGPARITFEGAIPT